MGLAINTLRQMLLKLIRSIWLFPILLTIILILFTMFRISGSSIGIYHVMFYGDASDQSLVTKAIHPQSIRSDEWIVNSQKAIAQQYGNYNKINTHLGTGENEALLADTPTNNWSVCFKPHNIGFLILPFDNAFALRWWLLVYLLVLSTYFFILTLLPGRRMLATFVSSGFLFSPFFQWWYTYGTIGSVYYILFAITAFVRLYRARTWQKSVVWSALIAYLSVCFTLILYPPFQIPVALVALAFIVGYSIDHSKQFNRTLLKQKVFLLSSMLIVAICIVGLFLYQQRDVVATIRQTAYPGQRIVHSGGYNIEHLLSSNLSYVFQDQDRAKAYSRPEIGATNQSESSNFILITPLIIAPLALLLYRRYKQGQTHNYTALCLIAIGALFMAWAFIPYIDLLGKITLLSLVPLNRLLIGFGLLNILLLVVFIKEYLRSKQLFDIKSVTIYALVVFILYLLIDFHVMRTFPGFIGFKSAAILAIPFAVIAFLLLRRHFVTASFVFLLLSFASVYRINPLYQGTGILTQTPLSQTIRSIGVSSNDAWVSDYFPIENFPTMNGVDSLTGTYTYPQLALWDSLGLTQDRNMYNRYAHVSFTFDRDSTKVIQPKLKQATADQFNVMIEPCNSFFKQHHVGFLITTKQFSGNEAPCAHPIQTVTYPKIVFYIYRLKY